MGGKLHLRLNRGKRPIANKYREGKMKSTLKRELKAREIVKRETIEASRGVSVQHYLLSDGPTVPFCKGPRITCRQNGVYSFTFSQFQFCPVENGQGRAQFFMFCA